MEVVIMMAIIGAIVFFFKRTFSGFVYAVAMIDIFLRVLAFLKAQLLGGNILVFLNKWFPVSVPAMIDKYTDGTLYTILLWVYVGIMIVFLFYTVRIFIKKK